LTSWVSIGLDFFGKHILVTFFEVDNLQFADRIWVTRKSSLF